MNILFLGAPGCGKGTQAKAIIKKFSIPQISTGDLLRSEIKAESELGMEIKNIISTGNFVSDEIVLKLVSNKLKSNECKNGFILDGFPRNLTQAKHLDQLFLELSLKLNYVFLIDVPFDLLIKRCVGRITCNACGYISNSNYTDMKENDICPKCEKGHFTKREDDNEETVKNRLSVYQEQTQPIIDFYKEKNILHSIVGGEGPAIELTNQIFDILP
ncbi:MAG: adenylate kinase [Gammaproteobacteria bacterium]|nr:adenylate kinase [Gammaproteobacteria bacterium]|tara:strand:- start:2850 stop:3497 length:648 start_codon:yes stop_codon:yes gene_type:complete